MPAKIAAIVNHAGGVAKTTTALNLGYSFAQRGRRVLVADLDPQADLSERLGLAPEPPTLAQVLTGRKGPPRVQHCQWTDGAALDILAADFDDMAGIELALEKQMERERRLHRALTPLRERYDYIFLDCPPNLLLLTVNALYAADGVLIPVQTQAKAYRAVDKVLRTVGPRCAPNWPSCAPAWQPGSRR